MKIIFNASLFFCLLISCNSPVKKVTCEEIDAMMISDQLHRQELMSLSAQFYVADSLARKKYGDQINDSYYSEFWAEALEITSSRPESDFVDVPRKDSLWKIQKKIDDQNIERLLQIFETTPIDTLEEMTCMQVVLLPFVHASEKHADRVRKCIDTHKSFIGFNRYRHIRWNLDGREAFISEDDF